MRACAAWWFVHALYDDVRIFTYTISRLWSTCKDKARQQAQETQKGSRKIKGGLV